MMMGGGMGGFAFSISSRYDGLLNAPTVQKELKLSEEQIAKLKELREKAQTAMREMFSGMGNMRDMEDQERKAKMEEMGKKSQAQMKETQKALEAVLEAPQLQRLRGIAMQQILQQPGGVQQLLSDKQIQEELKLEKYQIAAIKAVGDRNGKKTRDLFTSAGGDFTGLREKSEELRKGSEKQMLGILTDEQRAALETMQGEKLEIPREEMMGGFGRGGFGGKGGPRGGGDSKQRPEAPPAAPPEG
jgi:Spy/CpxP family protein refolding chaperone